MAAAALIRTNASWSAPGAPVTVTWGVRQSGPAADASGNPAAFSQLTAAQATAVAAILAGTVTIDTAIQQLLARPFRAEG